ncbi:hypothetical protein Cgig2_002526 [Carnegiea gigantea]|uniref:Autophagy-related protein n=1 Tax=Carnegiea gigantea TaxID=171969 RepID=A0A9Q1KUZ6_9CARY|nr:hypothetical protein Cgig2_002526 [Carnegiea gigantea]
MILSQVSNEWPIERKSAFYTQSKLHDYGLNVLYLGMKDNTLKLCLFINSHRGELKDDCLINLWSNRNTLFAIEQFLCRALGYRFVWKKMAKNYFKQEHDLEKRRAEAARIREKYPDRIPVIVEKAERSDIPNIDKKKYLVPADLTVGQFVYVIRKRIKLSAEKAIFIFVDNVLPPTGAMMSAIYEGKKDEDGFLYVTYSGENTFGALPPLV